MSMLIPYTDALAALPPALARPDGHTPSQDSPAVVVSSSSPVADNAFKTHTIVVTFDREGIQPDPVLDGFQASNNTFVLTVAADIGQATQDALWEVTDTAIATLRGLDYAMMEAGYSITEAATHQVATAFRKSDAC